jgi:hypothetical protein
VPPALVALIVTVYVPAVVGVPEIKPVEVLTDSPRQTHGAVARRAVRSDDLITEGCHRLAGLSATSNNWRWRIGNGKRFGGLEVPVLAPLGLTTVTGTVPTVATLVAGTVATSCVEV